MVNVNIIVLHLTDLNPITLSLFLNAHVECVAFIKEFSTIPFAVAESFDGLDDQLHTISN
jgi:hypothetical protein